MSANNNSTIKRIRVAVVGLGWVSTHRHMPAMIQHGGFDFVGVVDRREGVARSYAERHGLRHFHQGADLSAVPWLSETDAIVVATGPASHYEIIDAALSFGKHVITEKPFTLGVDEGTQLVHKAGDRELILAVVHNFQFAASTRRMMSDLALGKLGNVKAVVATQYGNPRRRLPVWYEDLPLGLFFDEGPHLLYLIRRICGGRLQLRSCHMFPSTEGKQTPAMLTAHYSGSVTSGGSIPVTVSCHFESSISEWHVTVIGDRAVADVDVFRDIYVRLPNDHDHSTRYVIRTSAIATLSHWFQHLSRGPLHLRGRLLYGNDEVFRRFHAAVLSGEPPADISGTDGLAVLRMQHEIIEKVHVLTP